LFFHAGVIDLKKKIEESDVIFLFRRKPFPLFMTLALIAASVALLGCATTPPAETSASPAKERAAALVQGGFDAGQGGPASVPAGAAAQAATAGNANEGPPASAPAAEPQSPEALPPQPGQLSPAESAYLQNYLNRLNYMVFYNDKAQIDPKYAKIAVSQATRWLIEKMGLSVIDYDQIVKNKEDQSAAWQAETGGSIDLIQYLAQKFNADVYVEIDFSISQGGKDGAFTASAQGSIKIYETSTATLLGSIAFSGQPSYSPSSADAAATNAIAAAVWVLMPKVTEQAKALIANSLQRGIRYELIIQKTPDSRLVSNFRRALARNVREVEQVSYSPGETRLNVYAFLPGDKIEDAVYAAATQAGLRDLNLVYQRGRSYTFDSGS